MQPPGELDGFDDSSFRGPALKKGEVESLDYDIRDSTIFQVRTRHALRVPRARARALAPRG